MILGSLFDRRGPTGELRHWLHDDELAVRYRDRDRDGVPEDVVWLDEAGRLLQRWIDDDRAGRADRVALYRDGDLVRVLRR